MRIIAYINANSDIYMKSKIRKIVVSGIEYTWSLGKFNCDGDGGIKLKVYKDRTVIIEELITCDHNITPKEVADKIKVACA